MKRSLKWKAMAKKKKFSFLKQLLHLLGGTGFFLCQKTLLNDYLAVRPLMT